jgi:hypothetical protein
VVVFAVLLLALFLVMPTAAATPTDQVVGETTPPTCALTATRLRPPMQIDVTVQDASSGLASVVVTTASNLTVVWAPPWTPGATYPVIYTATKINQSLSSTLGLRVTDVAGNVTACDAVDLTIGLSVRRATGKPTTVTLTGIPRAENMITIANGTPGLTNLRITVNGTEFQVDGLKGGEVRELDVASAMLPGDNNTIAFTGLGKPEGAAWVLVHD